MEAAPFQVPRSLLQRPQGDQELISGVGCFGPLTLWDLQCHELPQHGQTSWMGLHQLNMTNAICRKKESQWIQAPSVMRWLPSWVSRQASSCKIVRLDPEQKDGPSLTGCMSSCHICRLQHGGNSRWRLSSGPWHTQQIHCYITLKLEALREHRPPWPRQIITLILPTVKMLSLGCERLPTPLKKKKKKKKKKKRKGSGSLPASRSGYATTITVFFCSFTHLTIPRSPPKFNQFFLVILRTHP